MSCAATVALKDTALRGAIEQGESSEKTCTCHGPGGRLAELSRLFRRQGQRQGPGTITHRH